VLGHDVYAPAQRIEQDHGHQVIAVIAIGEEKLRIMTAS
jgi:hypothetical protein